MICLGRAGANQIEKTESQRREGDSAVHAEVLEKARRHAMEIPESNINHIRVSRTLRRRARGRLLPALRDHEQRAAGPGRQHSHSRNKFRHKRWKKQHMKTDDEAEQNHRENIDNLINKRPAERPEEQLNRIRRNRNCQSQQDPSAGQRRFAQKISHGIHRPAQRTAIRLHGFYSANRTAASLLLRTVPLQLMTNSLSSDAGRRRRPGERRFSAV